MRSAGTVDSRHSTDSRHSRAEMAIKYPRQPGDPDAATAVRWTGIAMNPKGRGSRERRFRR